MRRKAFIRKWRLKHRAVADSLLEAGDRLFTFTRLPPSQWKSVRTTNLDVENKAAVDAAHREQHALRSTFRHVGVHRNRMRHLIRASWSYPLPCRLAAEDGYRSSLISTIRFWEPRTEV